MQDKIVNDKIDHKLIVDEIKTNAVVKNEAVNLLKEIRIISGVNSRSNSICYKSSIEFNFINKIIDKFKDKYELNGFKN